MIDHDIIASIAAFFSTVGYLPQTIKTIKTKDTAAISFWMYLLSLIGVIFWLIFGIMIGNYPILFKNSLIILLSSIILFFKVRNIFWGKEERNNLKFFKKIFSSIR